MPRLPNPGADDNIWGDTLNEYLSVGHNADGSHVNASTTSNGVVRLAGDLAGTADSPTVPGLSGKVDVETILAMLNATTESGSISRTKLPPQSLYSDTAATLIAASISSVPLIIRGSSGQTEDLQQWQKADGTSVTRIGASGNLHFGNSTNPAVSARTSMPTASGYSWSGGIEWGDGTGWSFALGANTDPHMILTDNGGEALRRPMSVRHGGTLATFTNGTGSSQPMVLMKQDHPTNTSDFLQMQNAAGTVVSRVNKTGAAEFTTNVGASAAALRLSNTGAGGNAGAVRMIRGYAQDNATETFWVSAGGNVAMGGFRDVSGGTYMNFPAGRINMLKNVWMEAGSRTRYYSPDGLRFREVGLDNAGFLSLSGAQFVADNWNSNNTVMQITAPGGGPRSRFNNYGDLHIEMLNKNSATDWGTTVPFSVNHDNDGASPLTANLAEFRLAGAVKTAITAGGLIKWSTGNVQTTVGAAGSASPIPAAPSKYLKVMGDDGVTYVIPAFATA